MTVEIIAPAAVPVEVVTPIKPSEAIRLGCLTTVQCFGDYGDEVAACAVGAAAIGWGISSIAAHNRMDDAVGAVVSARKRCPGGCGQPGYSAFNVAHFNDDHRWSRERIAAWLEGLGL